jgi:hypothetical protein
MGLQYDTKRLEAASAGLLALIDTPHPAAAPLDNLLQAVALAREAQQIAAHWDEMARQNKFTYKSHDGDFSNQISLALMVHDTPMWRV